MIAVFLGYGAWRMGLLDLARHALATGDEERRRVHNPKNVFGKEYWLDFRLSRFTFSFTLNEEPPAPSR